MDNILCKWLEAKGTRETVEKITLRMYKVFKNPLLVFSWLSFLWVALHVYSSLTHHWDSMFSSCLNVLLSMSEKLNDDIRAKLWKQSQYPPVGYRDGKKYFSFYPSGLSAGLWNKREINKEKQAEVYYYVCLMGETQRWLQPECM